MQRTLWLTLLTALTLATPAALAGTANSPEVVDVPNDSNPFGEAAIPGLEVTKAWVQPKGDRFNFVMEIGSLSAPQKDHVFVFHYTWQAFRLYYRANWSADGGEFQYFGGLYQGMQGPNAYDPDGNRNYLYLPGNSSQTDRIQGELIPGAPGRIVWSYPMDSYNENRDGLEFKGIFVTTYLKRADGSLAYIDTGLAQSDYVHKIHTPWYSKFLPGPSPLLVAIAAIGAIALAARAARRKE